jgi:AcrR family transcriptional regulator
MAPKPPLKPAYHHGDLPQQLVRVVRDLIETHGPDGFSVAEAARRAGVSSAAPYKHFKDRPELLRAVVSEGMDRLREGMEAAAGQHPRGSLEAVAAIGQAYVDFARTGPGVFRLMFSLTEGHENAPELKAKGQASFGVVLRATAERLGRAMDDPEVQHRAYILWTAVHGHCFLTIDRKTDVLSAMIVDHDYLMTVTRAVLGK